jgi:hypothetical protein
MAEYLVTCINKPHPQSSHEEITHIGNLKDNWRLTLDGAIYQIEKKISKFYTVDNTTGRQCFLEVVRELGGKPYLKAHADAKWIDNLLAQAECGENCNIIS